MENNSYCCLLADTCDFIRDSSCPTRKLNQYMMSEPKSERKRNFQCPLCPSSFYRKGDLTQHIRRHLKEKAFPCNQCSYSTWTSSNLCRHVKAVHEELAPFECSFSSCNYRTVHNGHLQRHHRTHSTDPLSKRPFPCDFDGCDYRATQKATLTRHIRRRHSENREKNFDCSLCPRRFYEKSDLQRHINEIHLKETTYSCSKCPYKSSRQCQVSAHLQAVHGMVKKVRINEYASQEVYSLVTSVAGVIALPKSLTWQRTSNVGKMRLVQGNLRVRCANQLFLRKLTFNTISITFTRKRRLTAASNVLASHRTGEQLKDPWKPYILILDELVNRCMDLRNLNPVARGCTQRKAAMLCLPADRDRTDGSELLEWNWLMVMTSRMTETILPSEMFVHCTG